jgi:NADPH:quinone reductase
MAGELFDLVQAGKIKPDARRSFALEDAAEAHRTLESRKTTGSTLLIP